MNAVCKNGKKCGKIFYSALVLLKLEKNYASYKKNNYLIRRSIKKL